MQASTSTSVLSAPTRILPCSCKHEFQAKRYGASLRVHNPCKRKGGEGVGYRCTVCGSEK